MSRRSLTITLVFLGTILASTALADKWSVAYEKGLAESRKSNWAGARQFFLDAISDRAADSDRPSQIGTSITNRRPWRDGAAYSPNFAAAYSAFKMAANAANPTERKDLLAKSIEEFRSLTAKGQESIESMLFLAAALAADNRAQEAAVVQERLQQIDPARSFKVDRDVIDYEDMRVLSGVLRGTGNIDTVGMALPGLDNPFGIVPALDYKFALIIGVGEGSHAYATADVDLLKDALVRHAGYAEENVTTLKNPTSAQFSTAAKTLADAMPDGGTVLIYYTGPVQNDESGRDRVGFADGGWASKHDLYAQFVPKGANIFTFYQVDRKLNPDGRVFGGDIPQVGKIAQSMGAAPGETCNSTVHENSVHGAYTVGFVNTLAQMRNNRIAIGEFAWMVFDVVRRGAAGGGSQTPTLPIYVGLASTSRF